MLPGTRSDVRSTSRPNKYTTPDTYTNAVGPSASDAIAHGVVDADNCAFLGAPCNERTSLGLAHGGLRRGHDDAWTRNARIALPV